MHEHAQTHLRRPFLHSSVCCEGVRNSRSSSQQYFTLHKDFLLVRILYCIYRYAFTYTVFIMLQIIVLYLTFVFPLGNLRVTREDNLIYNKGVKKLAFLATAVFYVA